MAINLNAFPFDSQIIGYGVDGLPEYDRASNSEEFASLLHSFWRDGVFGTSALTVLAGSGMAVTVGEGSVLIQGRIARVTSAKTLTFDTADSQPRFDRVVARSDLSNSVRDIVLDIVKGVPASSPAAPSLTRNQSKWELCLATVRIPANVSVIQQSNITDTRLDSELCGLVAATMTDVDTTTFYEQIQSDLQEFREVEQNQFLEWFDSVRDVLDENAAGNLYNKIENLTAADVGAVSSVNGVTPDINGDVDLLDQMYPVGIIIPFANSVEPAAIWGGTWELLAEGRTLIQSGTRYPLGSTGGETTHALTIEEMPSHGHAIRHLSDTGTLPWGYSYQTQKAVQTEQREGASGIGFTGGSKSHNNMPPFLAVNLWKRTA